ncbi:MAG: helix-turn-helix domain-containing protein [Thermoanaerobaculales bacterium]
MPTTILPRLLTEQEAAQALGVRQATLATWRCTRRYDLPYVKAGRLVRYRAEDLAAFIQRRLVGAIPLEPEAA